MYIIGVANMFKPFFSRSSVAILLILACFLLAAAISFSSCPEENELEMLVYTLEKKLTVRIPASGAPPHSF